MRSNPESGINYRNRLAAATFVSLLVLTGCSAPGARAEPQKPVAKISRGYSKGFTVEAAGNNYGSFSDQLSEAIRHLEDLGCTLRPEMQVLETDGANNAPTPTQSMSEKCLSTPTNLAL